MVVTGRKRQPAPRGQDITHELCNKKPLLLGRRPILVQSNRGPLLSQEKPMQHSPGE